VTAKRSTRISIFLRWRTELTIGYSSVTQAVDCLAVARIIARSTVTQIVDRQAVTNRRPEHHPKDKPDFLKREPESVGVTL
jgi:hypothetical protein